MSVKMFLYVTPEKYCPVLVFANHRPSKNNIPRSGTWIVKEWIENQWGMPCFPEITWGMLKTLQFVGEVKQSKEKEVKK